MERCSRLDMVGGLSSANMVGSHVKIAKANSFLRQFKMHSVDNILQVDPPDATRWDTYEMTVYVPSALLREHRAIAVSSDWEAFCEHVNSVMGRKVSQNEICALLGHGPYTIKRSLGLTGGRPPKLRARR